MRRLGIHYKRGRHYVHSPDRNYQSKVDLIEQMRLRAYYDAPRTVLLYLDELTFYRQPTVAAQYEAQGPTQPLAYRSHRANTDSRILGALDAITGQGHYRQRRATTIACLPAFWYELVAADPHTGTA